MKSFDFKFFKTTSCLLFLCVSGAFAQKNTMVKSEAGVSRALAVYRRAMIDSVNYKIAFQIPQLRTEAIDGEETISVYIKKSGQPLWLDFKGKQSQISSVAVNGRKIKGQLADEHLFIDETYLTKGLNRITIVFVAGNASLNRNDDYLYALFVPDRARTVFPCFDQPDIKARFSLTLLVPEGWKTLANGIQTDSVSSPGGVTCHFKTTEKLPTYLFSFAAGRFKKATSVMKYPMQFLYRETDPAKISLSVDSVFKIHDDAIRYLEKWTEIPFPFQKVGFIAVPDFQFGGMEHPGEVQYRASSLFLDQGATKDQFINRITLISHETTHMWFGDLVTMDWFNDVWMKEVFANFMADKVTEKLMGRETFNLKFFQDHYPSAYAVDRTPGANPIRQELSNLQDAGTLYGNIIYNKAPIMLRQLENLMGQDQFQKGVREYLKKYSYGNASWNDLIAILNRYSHTNLYEWNKVWVNRPGRPVFDYHWNRSARGVESITIRQKAEHGGSAVWPEQFDVLLIYPGREQSMTINMKAGEIKLPVHYGKQPPVVIFNSDGLGYGLFPVDSQQSRYWESLKEPVQRASSYTNAYENMLAGRCFSPAQLLNLFFSELKVETSELNIRQLSSYIRTIYWQFISPAERDKLAPQAENVIWAALEKQMDPGVQKILFKCYQDVYLSAVGAGRIYKIWSLQQAPGDIKLTEDDYTSLALTIALKSDTAKSVIDLQIARIQNPDRKARLIWLKPSLSADDKTRDAFFESLFQQENRRKEAWVATALSLMNHPLRQANCYKFLPECLNKLEEIKRTGDIFFPQAWLDAIFSNYQSPEAWQVVKVFLKAHPGYNPKLRDKILQSIDNLGRAQTIIPKAGTINARN